MSNGTKILIILILIIVAIACGVKVGNETFNKEENKTENKISSIFDSLDQKNKNNNITKEENNTVENNETVNEVSTNEVKKEEIKNEITGLNDEQKAIKLAQDEWGISISSYDFNAELISGKKYKVTVISKNSNRTTVAIYIVDVDKGTVTEE